VLCRVHYYSPPHSPPTEKPYSSCTRGRRGCVCEYASCERLDHSHPPDGHSSLGRYGDTTMGVLGPMGRARLLVASVARLLMRDHSSLHAPLHFPRSQHRVLLCHWRRRRRRQTQLPEMRRETRRDETAGQVVASKLLPQALPIIAATANASRRLSNPLSTVRRQPAT